MNKIFPVFFIFLVACGSNENFVPKPHGYPRIVFPEKVYSQFDMANCPYSFEIPTYSKMEKDTVSDYTSKPNWFNLNFKPYNATLHITYYRFNNWKFFDSLVMDARKLVNKHIQRADDILEEPIHPLNPSVNGLIFRIEGNTATNFNFYITDSSKNFFRGALYFNRQTQQDSIAPVFDYIEKDVMHLIKTFKWK